jgi:hypothetical protein
MIDTAVTHPAAYLVVKFLTLLTIAAIYWFVTVHASQPHLPHE